MQPDDPHLPRFHFQGRPWMNDPIPFYWEGDWHVFYQHNPRAATWGGGFEDECGSMHWGHAVSRDLVRWQLLPLALAPSPGGCDQDGCWTGCVIAADGGFYLYYTAIPEYRPTFRQVQALATSEDLINWEKFTANPLIFGKPAYTGDCFRDPCVFAEPGPDGRFTMIVGSEKKDGTGGLALRYRSHDLLRWTYTGSLCEGRREQSGHDFECPDLFPLGEKSVLLTSRGRQWAHVGAYANGKLEVESVSPIESDRFYAGKTAIDSSGRRLLFGWVTDPPITEGSGDPRTWSGVLSMPRELYLTPRGRVGQRPVVEWERLRGRSTFLSPFEFEGYTPLEALTGDCFELRVVLELSPTATQAGVVVRTSPDGEMGRSVMYSMLSRALDTVPCEADPAGPIELRVFVDRGIIEAFCHGAASTQRYEPRRPDARGIALTSDGPVRVISVDWSELDPGA